MQPIRIVPHARAHSNYLPNPIGFVVKRVDYTEEYILQMEAINVQPNHLQSSELYDVCGVPINIGFAPYRLLSYYDLSEKDQIWLLKSVLWCHRDIIASLWNTQQPAFDTRAPIMRLLEIIFMLDVGWTALSEILEFVRKQECLYSLSMVQARQYVADQFGLKHIDETIDVPNWFKRGHSSLLQEIE